VNPPLSTGRISILRIEHSFFIAAEAMSGVCPGTVPLTWLHFIPEIKIVQESLHFVGCSVVAQMSVLLDAIERLGFFG